MIWCTPYHTFEPLIVALFLGSYIDERNYWYHFNLSLATCPFLVLWYIYTFIPWLRYLLRKARHRDRVIISLLSSYSSCRGYQTSLVYTKFFIVKNCNTSCPILKYLKSTQMRQIKVTNKIWWHRMNKLCRMIQTCSKSKLTRLPTPWKF